MESPRIETAVSLSIAMLALMVSLCNCSSVSNARYRDRPPPDGMSVSNDVITINGVTAQNITIRSSGGNVSIGMPGDAGVVSYAGSTVAYTRLGVDPEAAVRLVLTGSHNRVVVAEPIRPQLTVIDRGEGNKIAYR